MDNNQDSEDKENPPPDSVPTLPLPASPLDDKELNQKQEELNKDLLSACDSENDEVDLEEVKRLLRAGADINTTDSDGRTCLMHTGREERKI